MKKVLAILLFLPFFARAGDGTKYIRRFVEVSEPIHQIRITNLFGQIIFNETYNRSSVAVSIEGFPAGRYIVRINETMYTYYSTDGKIRFTTYLQQGGKL